MADSVESRPERIGRMQVAQILAEVNQEIARLTQVRKMLAGVTGHVAKPRKKPRISAAGRAKIAAAQRARWAKLKKAAPVLRKVAK
jgi:hypothetical protein